MDKPVLRLMIQEKLGDGRLPHDSIPWMWGGPGNGKTCDGCGQIVTKAQMIIEGLSEGRSGQDAEVQFHVACFYVWDVERQILGLERRIGVVATSLQYSASVIAHVISPLLAPTHAPLRDSAAPSP